MTNIVIPAYNPLPFQHIGGQEGGAQSWQGDPNTKLPDNFAIKPILEAAKMQGDLPPKTDTGSNFYLVWQFKLKYNSQ
eukprot:8792848-Ditylum_brightwellii.AAC.1